jgi:hypoxanthine phosphoribosyltransferase
MKKIYYTWQQVEGACLEIARQMHNHYWRPDYIVGITRGGLVPANLLSQYMGIKMNSLDISLRDGGDTVSNLGMAEDAFNGKKKYFMCEVRHAASDNVISVHLAFTE